MTKRLLPALLLLLLTPVPAPAAGPDEPPMPEEAFRLSLEVVDAATVRARWQITDEAYLYQDKFRFRVTAPEGVRLGEVKLPPGKRKYDEILEKEIVAYYHEVTVDLPLVRTVPDRTVKLYLEYQGCSERFGICYPPIKKTVTLELPPLPAAAGAGESKGAVAALSRLREKVGVPAPADEPPMPEEAFRLGLEVVDAATVRARWQITDEAYLYQDKFRFRVTAPEGVRLGEVKLPPGKRKYDEILEKEIVAYYHEVTVDLPLVRTVPDRTVKLYLEYQGCSERFGICYPPIKKTVTLELPPLPGAETGESAVPDGAEQVDRSALAVLGYLITGFFIGLGLTFTPCVLPMLPIISSVIIGQQEKVTRLRGGLLAGTYVLGTAVVWTAAGVMAGKSGQQLQAYLTHPWVLIPISVILFLLALAMFGLYTLQVPASIQSKLQEKSMRIRGGTFPGVFLLGVLASAIAGACVSPVLFNNLLVAIQARDPVLGGAIMLATAAGMGVPVILLGMGAGWLLPKAGPWMDTVKYIFGVILVGLAIYVLSLIGWFPVLYLWGVFLMVTGIYMGALEPVPEGASRWRFLWKGLGLVLVFWGALALLGALQGNRNILHPLDLERGAVVMQAAGPGPAGETAEAGHLFTRVADVDDLKARLAEAKAAGQPVIVDYYADWCTDCIRMEESTFKDPRVRARLKDFVLLQADVTDQYDPRTQPLKQFFNVFGPPAMIFIDRQGRRVSFEGERAFRNGILVGYLGPDDFLRLLDKMEGRP